MTWYQNPDEYWPREPSAATRAGIPQSAGQQTGGPAAPAFPEGAQPFGRSQQDPGQQAEPAAPPAAVPAVDVVETASEIVVSVDVPGFETEHLQIHADGTQLYVSGDRSEDAGEEADDGEQVLLAERPVRVERTIPLAIKIDPESVSASHENGVCEIVVPKDGDQGRHEIGFQ